MQRPLLQIVRNCIDLLANDCHIQLHRHPNRTIKSMPSRIATAATLALIAWVPAQAQTPLSVVATVGMIGDVAQTIGGSCVNVETMMGPGIDPHLYQATARDVQTLNDADLILYSGYGLEGQLGDVFRRYSERVPTVAVSEAGIPASLLISTDDAAGVDPHVWMDVSLWALTVPAIAAALSENVPDCASSIEANAERYGAELAALDDGKHWFPPHPPLEPPDSFLPPPRGLRGAPRATTPWPHLLEAFRHPSLP